MSNRAQNRARTGVSFTDNPRTKQSFKDECDINIIVKRHATSGIIPPFNQAVPRYGDFSLATDLKSSMDQVNDAELAFSELPSQVRSLCDNDPVRLLELLAEEPSKELLEAAGFVVPDDSDGSTDDPSQPDGDALGKPSASEASSPKTP